MTNVDWAALLLFGLGVFMASVGAVIILTPEEEPHASPEPQRPEAKN